jgi:hypothetical protein
MINTTFSVALYLTGALFVPSGPFVGEDGHKDPRMAKITREQLRKEVKRGDQDPPAHMLLIHRTNYWGLIDEAYQQYTAVWRTSKTEPFANLFRGEAALLYWEAMGFGTRYKYDPKKSKELTTVIRDCFKTAAEAQPPSAIAICEYGFFLWQFDNQMAKGLALLEKAANLAPEEPLVHCRLGLVHLNPTGNAHNAALAKRELETAIQLDPLYAAPHNCIKEVYRQLGMQDAVERAKRAYRALVPDGADTKNVIADH